MAGRIVELQDELAAARAEDRRNQALIRTLENQTRSARHELNSVSNELKALKAKYDSTQKVLKRERKQLKAARNDLAKAEAIVSRYRRSIPWRIYLLAVHGLTRLNAVYQRIFGGTRKRQRERALALLEQSSLFDREWYLETYPDVARSGIDPALHYLETGWLEGRDAGPAFSTNAYLKANADVAAHAINPLLHFVEFGHSEGRGAPEQAAPKLQRDRPRQQFPEAAPCASFPLSSEPVVRWARAGKIDAGRCEVLRASDLTIGYFREDATRCEVQAALLNLTDPARELSAEPSDPGTAAAPADFLDAWYMNRNTLRSRWTPKTQPIVVRALQQTGDGPVLVAEALVSSHGDLLDATLINPFFPLLFLFCDTGGGVLGWSAIIFPSLCRGGLHYPELLLLAQRASGSEGTVDPCVHSEILGRRLKSVVTSGQGRLIEEIDVDLTAADASGPLFQPDFQDWLREIVGVSVKAREQVAADDREQYLAAAVEVSPRGHESDGAGTLSLEPDMYPSISALVSGAAEGADGARSQILPLIANSAEVSQPATLVHVPADAHFGLGTKLPILLSAGSPGDVPVGALRSRPSQQLRDAELLVPIAAPMLDLPKSELGTTWLFWPDAWPAEGLVQSLMSIAAQTDAGPNSIALVGSDDSAAAAASAEQLFPGRVRSFLTIAKAARAIDTPLVAYVGPNVILHDQRTATALSAMLHEPGAASSSVVLVSIVKRGRSWSAAVSDAGAIPSLSGLERTSEAQARDALLLWRGTWSTMKPPRDLWMVRTASLQAWLNGTAISGGRHLCSSMLTASYVSPRETGEAPVSPPATHATSALRIETLIG